MKSLATKAPAMMSLADPTMLVDPEHKMMLSWHLGGLGWDPLPTILTVIRKAMGKCGAKHVAFLGGSGGGFAALRASAMLPGSLAFIQDPQVTIAKYATRIVQTYFDTVWKGWNAKSLMAAFPERFDMAQHYRGSQPQNFVYYAQNSTDRSHVLKHYEPFVDACGLSVGEPVLKGRRRFFNLYEGTKSGHGKFTPEEFDRFYGEALTWWRENRSRCSIAVDAFRSAPCSAPRAHLAGHSDSSLVVCSRSSPWKWCSDPSLGGVRLSVRAGSLW